MQASEPARTSQSCVVRLAEYFEIRLGCNAPRRGHPVGMPLLAQLLVSLLHLQQTPVRCSALEDAQHARTQTASVHTSWSGKRTRAYHTECLS